MEYKKCEHCGEEIHIRSKKCPFCNNTVAEGPEKVEESSAVESKVEESNVIEEKDENTIKENENINNANAFFNMTNQINATEANEDQSKIDFAVGPNGEPKDYVYKAEVRHTLEYTTPMSNTFKVFISALTTVPIIGQLIGVFLGVFFSTYDDSDKRSFGKALIFLAIFMFVIYLAYVKYAMSLLGDIDIESLYKSLQ